MDILGVFNVPFPVFLAGCRQMLSFLSKYSASLFWQFWRVLDLLLALLHGEHVMICFCEAVLWLEMHSLVGYRVKPGYKEINICSEIFVIKRFSLHPVLAWQLEKEVKVKQGGSWFLEGCFTKFGLVHGSPATLGKTKLSCGSDSVSRLLVYQPASAKERRLARGANRSLD